MSLYLDLVRFLAALVVFIVHANYHRFTGGLPLLWRLSDLGNEAVMVFFVLSGFVIAFVANTKERKFKDFMISRFARLYSVVFPALLLTIVLDAAGWHFGYRELFEQWGYRGQHPLARTLANLFFVNQLWFLNVRPFSNVPFWSIGYEFWYYVLFAASFYFRGSLKYLGPLGVSVLVGPKILLLLPVWWMGVLVFKITSKNSVSERYGWLFFLTSLILYFLYTYVGGHQYVFEKTEQALGASNFASLSWSREFVDSYVMGLLVSCNFIGFSAISHRFSSVLRVFERPIRYCASYTFAMYLLHYPLLQFYAAVSYDETTGKTAGVVIVVWTLVSVWLLGFVTERQKGRYKKWFSAALDRACAQKTEPNC